ncbi:MAG: hypothetical protein FD146_143 [Anaerolineaceae bacterium]|nr:MAG: hypothetical protein FD146_143 [Anaerolineaceae bacterium]
MEEKKPSKTGAIIGTVAAVVLCGCPGLAMCLGGAVMTTGLVPYETSYYYTHYIPWYYGMITLCLSIFFIAIPVVVGVLTLRTKKDKAPEAPPADILPPSEPLPPAA